MRMGVVFGEWDIEKLKSQMPADLYAEWQLFFMLEPQGWEAQQLVATRLTYIIAQVNSKRSLREKSFVLRPAAAAVETERGESLKWEAFSIQGQVAEALAAGADPTKLLPAPTEEQYLLELQEMGLVEEDGEDVVEAGSNGEDDLQS